MPDIYPRMRKKVVFSHPHFSFDYKNVACPALGSLLHCLPACVSHKHLILGLFFFFFFWERQAHSPACWILVPHPGIKPVPPAVGGRVLTTGSPKKFQHPIFLNLSLTYHFASHWILFAPTCKEPELLCFNVTFLPTVHKGSSFSAFLPTLVIFCFSFCFGSSHPSGHEIVSRCG